MPVVVNISLLCVVIYLNFVYVVVNYFTQSRRTNKPRPLLSQTTNLRSTYLMAGLS